MDKRVVWVPLDYYMAVDGLRVHNQTRWVTLTLHEDGTVTWEEPTDDRR